MAKKRLRWPTAIKAGRKVRVSGKKTVKEITYYNIGNGQFIKDVNVDSKNHKVAKSDTRRGRVIKGIKVCKDQKIKIFGSAVTINGKKYYATNKGYISAKALAKKVAPVEPDEPTVPSINNNKGNNTNNSSSNSNTANPGNNDKHSSNSNSNTDVQTKKASWQNLELTLKEGTLFIPGSQAPITNPTTIVSTLDTAKINPDEVTKVVIEGNLKLSGDAKEVFSQLHQLTTIDGLNRIDTTEATSIQSMFYGCRKLNMVDLSSFDTAKVTDIHDLFKFCNGLTSVTFGAKFNTSNVTDMHDMFANSDKLSALKLDKFNVNDTVNVTNAFAGTKMAKITVAKGAKKLLKDGKLSNLASLKIDLNNLSDTATEYPVPVAPKAK